MPFECEICKKRFADKRDIDEHMLRHKGIKAHVCPTCGMRKTTMHELKVHMNYHTREKLYPCTMCDYKAASPGNRTKHIRTVHFRVKNFHCPHCDSSFATGDTLKHHIRRHTGEKPYGCEACGRRFIQLSPYRTHMKKLHGTNVWIWPDRICLVLGNVCDLIVTSMFWPFNGFNKCLRLMNSILFHFLLFGIQSFKGWPGELGMWLNHFQDPPN